MIPFRNQMSALLACSLMTLGTAAAQPCLSETSNREQVSGTLSIERVKDGVGRFEWHFLLSLAAPVCLATQDAKDRVDGTRSVHVMATDPIVASSLSRHVGTAITVRGRAFAAHTPHHHAPIVLDASAVEATVRLDGIAPPHTAPNLATAHDPHARP